MKANETKRYGIVRRHVALVWCGGRPRLGSGQHMRRCGPCKAARARFWRGLRRGGAHA